MKKSQRLPAVFACLGMVILILDGKTALSGAGEGLSLVWETVIPSLFPFFFLSILITGGFSGTTFPILRLLGKIFRIPEGAEPVLISAFLGGYPTGVQAVATAWKNGSLKKEDAQQMMAFCNNPGPAFLFGMVASFFPKPGTVWLIWGILLLSAAAVSQLFPCSGKKASLSPSSNPVTPVSALKSAVMVTAQVCGWVILFRTMMAFLQRWILWLLPAEGQAAVIGALELSNGCCFLSEISDLRLRFVLCCGMLSFGGVCVAMQTVSVSQGLSMKNYWIGKGLQTVLCIAAAIAVQYRFFFPLVTCILFTGVFLIKKQKRSSNLSPAGV